MTLGPAHELAHPRLAVERRGEHQPVGDATGRLHQTGGGQVGGGQHHARREAHETGAAVGLLHDHTGDRKALLAQHQGVARHERQCVEQAGIDPDRAARRAADQHLLRAANARGQAHLAAQRVGIGHGLDSDQPRRTALGIGRARHARKTGAAGQLQAEHAGPLSKCRRRSLVAGQYHVTAQQLAGIAHQRSLEPGREETHRAERCHRQHHRDHQQPQFAGAKVAPALAPGQGEDGDRQCVGVHEQDGTPTARRLGPPCRCDLNAACSGFKPAAAQPLL